MESNPTSMRDVSISPLWEVPSFAPVLAQAHAREWGHLYANWNEKVALADFETEREGTAFPATWVAHHPSHGPMGSVSLVQDDLPDRPALNPWLASLFVFPEFRGRGLGKSLVQEALGQLRRRGHPQAFLFTENRVSYFAEFNFTFQEQARAKGHLVSVMKWTHPDAQPSVKAGKR